MNHTPSQDPLLKVWRNLLVLYCCAEANEPPDAVLKLNRSHNNGYVSYHAEDQNALSCISCSSLFLSPKSVDAWRAGTLDLPYTDLRYLLQDLLEQDAPKLLSVAFQKGENDPAYCFPHSATLCITPKNPKPNPSPTPPTTPRRQILNPPKKASRR